MVAMHPPASGVIILFGASGDLASRKLYPAIHHLYERGRLGERFAVIGTARRMWDDAIYRDIVAKAVQADLGPMEDETVDELTRHFFYVPNDATKIEHFATLKAKIDAVREQFDCEPNYLHYLSISPRLFGQVTENLKASGITALPGTHRVLVEKPFGHDQASAIALNDELSVAFDHDNIFRIDHYIGKETVQNIWFLRHYNPFIEAMWNRKYIDNIQITLSEDLPVGSRGKFYDKFGALLDMFQNHILQLLSFIGMDLPETDEAWALHRAKTDFLRSIPSLTPAQVSSQIVRGQYGQSERGDIQSYRKEMDIPSDSMTETFVAGKLMSEKERWFGVPFYFRTGKQLGNGKYTTVEIVFKSETQFSRTPARLTFVITPSVGVRLTVNEKHFGTMRGIRSFNLYPETDALEDLYMADPYEVILEHAFRGDRSIFTTMDEVKEQWRITDSIKAGWEKYSKPIFPNYAALSDGPEDARRLIEQDGRHWVYEPQWRSKRLG